MLISVIKYRYRLNNIEIVHASSNFKRITNPNISDYDVIFTHPNWALDIDM